MNTVELERPSAHVALLELHRPARRNALNFALVAELHTALDEVSRDDACRVELRARTAGSDEPLR